MLLGNRISLGFLALTLLVIAGGWGTVTMMREFALFSWHPVIRLPGYEELKCLLTAPHMTFNDMSSG